MNFRTFHIASVRPFLLLLFLLAFVPSCNIFHKNTVDPYTDFTTDQLRNYRISKILLVIPDSTICFPGASFPLGIVAVISNGKELKTRNLSGFVNWNSYAVTVMGGTFDNGMVTLEADPRNAGSHFTISVIPIAYPGLKQNLELPFTYKAKFIADCKGQKGTGGINGLTGAALHRLDTTKQFHVYDGRRGQAGSDGGTGQDGCIADVYVKAITVENKKMMSVLVINHCNNAQLNFYVDPDGGSLLVDVSGGDGGDGGNGGDGENGVDGAGASYLYTTVTPEIDRYNSEYYKYGIHYIDLKTDSTYNPTGNGGDGGIGGNGGRGGLGGNGGIAIIHIDSSAVQWKDKINADNSGGKPGKPGNGGLAGWGGNGAYLMQSKKNGNNGYIGAEGMKGTPGKPGETILRIEKVEMKW
ncbi:MAG: hypothetical protein ABIQ40_01790 [Bacteroidia bacterium]